MIFNLTKKQLDWLLEGTRYKDEVRNLFNDHYVRGLTKSAAAKANNFSLPFSSKKFNEFDKLIYDRCKTHNLQISTIIHSPKDKKNVFSYDVSNTQT